MTTPIGTQAFSDLVPGVSQARKAVVLDENKAIDTMQVKAMTRGTAVGEGLKGTVVADVLTANVIGAIPVIHIVTVPDAASADYDVVLTHKTRITNVEVVKTGGAGGAGNTITVKNGANAITDAIDTNDADKVISRAATLDDAFQDIAAGGTLRVSSNEASDNSSCIVYVYGLRVA